MECQSTSTGVTKASSKLGPSASKVSEEEDNSCLHENDLIDRNRTDIARCKLLLRDLVQVIYIPEVRDKTVECPVLRSQSTMMEVTKASSKSKPSAPEVSEAMISHSRDDMQLKAVTTSMGMTKASSKIEPSASKVSEAMISHSTDDVQLKAAIEEYERTKKEYDKLKHSYREKQASNTSVRASPERLSIRRPAMPDKENAHLEVAIEELDRINKAFDKLLLSSRDKETVLGNMRMSLETAEEKITSLIEKVNILKNSKAHMMNGKHESSLGKRWDDDSGDTEMSLEKTLLEELEEEDWVYTRQQQRNSKDEKDENLRDMIRSLRVINTTMSHNIDNKMAEISALETSLNEAWETNEQLLARNEELTYEVYSGTDADTCMRRSWCSDDTQAKDLAIRTLETTLYKARETNEELRLRNENMRPVIDSYELENASLRQTVTQLQITNERAADDIGRQQKEIERQREKIEYLSQQLHMRPSVYQNSNC
eukprot:CAMPEP_0172486330 /NCGR_PEP_ID=MMETSP1066-20121228/14877_1 /TAXON_ID=671091 /ORGANISM="Coscinodiscus wailesii, Strain CCMP2513" /LENGTH=484 /DNA_ID=CAMNT_0013252221 /DNA_START=331 /DNA_END=1785 /DNA_ORIENTATION=+